ncbi:hypothetical protein H0H87_010200 [Tephrocybe sp. NHM501043]|nr:hypothetical protein H0H87_010200 [Tephrocybe sp. NHM501043]
MNDNPYPSPLSTAASPPTTDDTLPTAPAASTTDHAPRDPPGTSMSLQQASSALENAYQRIRQFRRSLLEVADSTSSTAGRTFRPTDLPYPGPNRSRRASSQITGYLRTLDSSTSTSDTPDTVSDSEDDDIFPSQTLLSGGRPSLPRITTTSNPGRLPPRTIHPALPAVPPSISPIHPFRESRFSRMREYLPDDASTSLGRRVAAREAAGTANADPGSSTASSHWPRYENHSADILARLEREIEAFDGLSRQENAAGTPSANVRAFRRINSRLRVMNQSASQANPPNNSSLVPQPDSIRRRLIGTFPSRSSTMSTQSDRLSLLSNFSVQNLSTPVSATSSRPLLFEEPSSYVRAADFIEDEARGYMSWSPGAGFGEGPERSYVVRRTFNADGEEHVHPINLDWLDDSLYAAHGTGRRAAQRGQAEATAQRRRGWARLDRDGNEIPSEEEEELERARSEYRRRARSQLVTDTALHSAQAPTTSTSLTPGEGEDDPLTNTQPRVRLGPHARSGYPGSVMDSVTMIDTTAVKKSTSAPVNPYLPSPLPIPIEDMVWTPPKRKCRVNGVSRHASFAGR